MKKTPLRIATRKSPLAVWQAEHIKTSLQNLHPSLEIELVLLSTQGDRILDSALNKVGGKGLFVKELELALLENRADIAVHSMKDVPMEFPAGLHLPVIGKREDPRDALVANNYKDYSDLPTGSIVGTSSLRRECQLRATRTDIQIKVLRGNVNTRLKKLDAGEFDAIILAAAGLKRLQFADRISSYFEPTASLPAAGQGALGIECRSDDATTLNLIAPLNDATTQQCVLAERALVRHLNGSCQVPIGAFAELEEDQLTLHGIVGHPDGNQVIRTAQQGPATAPEQLGIGAAKDLLKQGAGEILQALGVL